MRTEKQRAASRLNGARSRGPITEAGKRRCCRNARRHGLYSKDALSQLADTTDDADISPLAAACRDHMRLLVLETRILNEEIERQCPLHPGAPPRVLHAIAFRRLTDETGVMEALFRLERSILQRIENAAEPACLNSPLSDRNIESTLSEDSAGSNTNLMAAPTERAFGRAAKKSHSRETDPGTSQHL